MANTRTTVKILNKSLSLITEVRALYPLNNQGTILRYSDELSDFGYCSFRVSTKDPLLSTYGDILKPLEYNIHVYRGNTVVWKGIIVDNPERNRNFIEVKAVQYEWFLDKVLINRDADKPDTDLDESNFRKFNSGTLATAVTNIVNEAKARFGTNHPLSALTIGTIENPNYPLGATDQNKAPLTGGWTFSDYFNIQFDYHSAYYVLKQLAIYAGCDFEITSDLQFNFKKFIGNKQTGVTFRYGTQGNIVDYNFPRFGGRVVNNLWGIAVDDEGKTFHHLNKEEASEQTYGLLEDAMAFADVKAENFLKSRVREESRLIKDPTTNPISIVLNEKSYPLGVFGNGDIVTIQVRDHVIDFNAPRRIVGITVNLHDTGREMITVQTNQPRQEDVGA